MDPYLLGHQSQTEAINKYAFHDCATTTDQISGDLNSFNGSQG